MADYDLQYTGAQIDGLLDAANELKTNGYIYKGVATPSTNPGTPTERVAYLASEPGTYTNFGGIVITSGLYSLTYVSGTWTGTQMQAGSDIEVVQTTGQSASDVMSQKAVTDEIASVPISYALTHFNDFIPATLWKNKSYEGLGLYTKTGYYSFGLIGLQAGAKVLLCCAEDSVITQQRSYVSDNYIIKQMSSGDTNLKDLTPVDISPTLKLYTLPSDRTNVGFTFNGDPADVRYYVLSEDSNIKDYLDEKSKPVDDLLDGLFFPINERLELNFISPSANLIIGTNDGYWTKGISTIYCRFIKVEPNMRYLVQAESNRKVQIIQLQDTSASNGAFPHFAGGVFNRVESSVNGESLIIDTMDDCEYLYFLKYQTSISLPSAITKRVVDPQKFYEEVKEAPVNIAGMVELAPVSGNGCYIDTNTWKWASNVANTFSVIYKVVGGSRLKITANSQGRAQCNLLKSINATAGDNVDFATGYEQVNIGVPAGTSTEVIIPNDAEYLYCLHHSGIPILEPAIVIGGYSVNGIDVIDFVGDSLTQRGYSITKPQADYPSKVIELTGVDGFNIGVGGENAATILGRCNGIPWKLASDVAIPADTTKVQIYLTNIYGQYLLPLLQRYTSHTIVIDGIEGTLTTTQTSAGAANADYFFQRKVSGTAYNAKAGDDIFVQDFKATLNPHRAKIIWIGQNGGFDTNSTSRYGGDITDPTDRARLIHMIKTYISVCGCEYYMVLSAPEKTNDDLEKEFAEAFGNRYFNVRMYMVKHGIDDAIALGYLSASGYPTAQDITDMNNGVVPTSLRADSVHFSTNGSYTMAHALSIKLKEVWNL